MCAMCLGNCGHTVSAQHPHLHIPLTVVSNSNKTDDEKLDLCYIDNDFSSFMFKKNKY